MYEGGDLLKRILIIFLIMIGLYLVISSGIANFFSFGGNNSEIKVGKNINTLEFDVSSARTNIIPENRDSVRAELSGKGKVTLDKNGDSIKVEYKRGLFNGFNFFNKTPKLNIYIPEDYKKEVDIGVSSGFVSLSGQSEKKPLELEKLKIDMSSGKVDLKNIVTEEFEHDGSSGMLDADTLIAGEGSIDMSSGKIKLRHYEGKLKGEVSSGQLDIQLDKLTDEVNLQASSGQIKLDLPDDANFTLNGKSSSGYIDCNLPLKNQITEKGEIKGVFGTGEHKIKVSVSSGHVKIH